LSEKNSRTPPGAYAVRCLSGPGAPKVKGTTESSLRQNSRAPIPNSRTREVQNIFRKVGVFFSAEKQPSNSPRFTTNPPQIHHKSPARKRSFFQNHPLKTPAKPWFSTRSHAQDFF
jgi:hypothetical protein